MTETITTNKIYEALIELKKEVDFIKNQMIERDIIMTSEEEARLEETLELHKAGKTKKLEDLKRN